MATRTAASNRVVIRNMPYSLLFTGAASNYVDLPQSFNPSTTSWSILMWIRPTHLAFNETGTSHAYYSQLDGSGTGRTWLDMTRPPDHNQLGSFFSGVDQLSTHYMARDIWQRVCNTYDLETNTLTFYANGVSVGLVTPTIESATGVHRLGSSKIGAANTYGYIGPTSVFNRKLSATEFLEDYTTGVISDTSNLVAKYDFTDGSGTTLTDSSGNANHGTIVGSDVSWSTVSPMKTRTAASGRVAASGRISV